MNTTSTMRDANKPATQMAAPLLTPQAIIQARMNYNSSRQRDPVTRAERDMSILSPDIDNNGGSLYNPETFCIVHRFENESDKQRRENEEDGYGSYSDVELHTYVSASFYDSYEEEEWSFEQPTYDYYGTNSDYYIQMVMDGDMVDNGMMCTMPSATLGGSVLLGGWTYDFNSSYDDLYGYGDLNLGSEFDYYAPLEFTEKLDGVAAPEEDGMSGMDIAADGSPDAPADMSAEASAETAEPEQAQEQVNQITNAPAANDDEFNATTAEAPKAEEPEEMDASAPSQPQSPSQAQTSMSAAASPIQSGIKLSNQFASASTPPSDTSEEPSAEAEIAPRAMAMAANQPSYQRSA